MKRPSIKLVGGTAVASLLMALPAAAQDLGAGDHTPDFQQIETLPAWRWSNVAVYHTDLGITDQGSTMLNGLAGAAMLVSSLMWRVLLWATKFATIDVIGDNAGAINEAFNSVAKPLVDARLHQIGLLAGFGWAAAKASKSLNVAAGLREGARVLLPYAVLVALMTNTAGASPDGAQPKLSLGGMMASADDKLAEFATLPSQIVADQSLFNNNADDDVCSGYRSWMHEQFAAANEGNPMAGIPQAVSSMWEVGYYELVVTSPGRRGGRSGQSWMSILRTCKQRFPKQTRQQRSGSVGKSPRLAPTLTITSLPTASRVQSTDDRLGLGLLAIQSAAQSAGAGNALRFHLIGKESQLTNQD